MRLSVLCAVLIFLPHSWVSSAFAHSDPLDTPQEIERLIRDLGHPAYATRERSFQRLQKIGAAAKPHLKQVANSSDAEIRQSVAYLSTAIEDRELAIQQQQALAVKRAIEAEFDAFIFSQNSVTYPGWDEFRKFVGDNHDSRAFFIGMHRNQKKLLKAFAEDGKEASALLETTLTDPNSPGFTCEEVGAFFMIAGDLRSMPLSPAPAEKLASLFDPQNLNSSPASTRSIFDKLVLRWLDRKTDTPDPHSLALLKTNIDRFYGRYESTVAMLKNLQAPGNDRLTAAINLLNNDQANIELLEPLLTDATQLAPQLQMRDCVLCVLVKFGNLNPAEFHLEKLPNNIFAFGMTIYQGTPVFETPDERDSAFAAWQAWHRANASRLKRLQAFAKNLDDNNHSLTPRWNSFRKIVGDRPETRALFVAMHDRQGPLLETHATSRQQAAQLINDWAASNSYTGQGYDSLASLAALTFVAGDPRVSLPIETRIAIANKLKINSGLWNLKESTNDLMHPLLDRLEYNHRYKTTLEFFVKTGRSECLLPGWKAFREILGNTHDSRIFFVEILLEQPQLLAAYERGPEEVAKRIGTSSQDSFFGAPSQRFCAAMFLIAGDKRVNLSDSTHTTLCTYLSPADGLYHPFSAVANFGDPLLHKLFLHWLDNPIPCIAYQKANLVGQLWVTGKIDILLAAALNPDLPEAHRARALIGLARVGDARNLEAIEPLLTDKHAKIRDLALGVLATLSKQPLIDYELVSSWWEIHELLILADPVIHLTEDIKRQQMIAKWREWSKNDLLIRARLAQFAKAPAKTSFEGLPAWNRYREIAGDTPATRALFVEMQYAECELLKLYESNPQQAATRLMQRCAQEERRIYLQEQQVPGPAPVSPGSVAAYALVVGDANIPCSPDTIAAVLRLLQRENCVRGKYQAELQPLIANWIKRQNDDDVVAAQQRWAVANEYRLKKQAVELARKLLQTAADDSDENLQQQAVFLSKLAKLHDTSYLEVIEPLLKNAIPINAQSGQLNQIQVRDIALAAAVQLTKQNWNQYKLRHVRVNEQGLFQWPTVYYDDSDDRDWAIRKWSSLSHLARPR